MAEKTELSSRKWVVVLICKLGAWSAGVFGVGGLMIVAAKTIPSMLKHGVYVTTAFASIAYIAATFGISPMAAEVEKSLQRIFRVKHSTPAHTKQ